jgi:hypothetical protein
MLSSADMTDILPSGGLWSGAGPVDVVVIGILAEGVVEVPAPMRRMRSMHSRRALTIHRSHAVHGPAL